MEADDRHAEDLAVRLGDCERGRLRERPEEQGRGEAPRVRNAVHDPAAERDGRPRGDLGGDMGLDAGPLEDDGGGDAGVSVRAKAGRVIVKYFSENGFWESQRHKRFRGICSEFTRKMKCSVFVVF